MLPFLLTVAPKKVTKMDPGQRLEPEIKLTAEHDAGS